MMFLDLPAYYMHSLYCNELTYSSVLQEKNAIIFLFFFSVITIGFNGTYSVHEDVEGISVVVFALMNSLDRDVVVTLLTLDGTARGRFAQYA